MICDFCRTGFEYLLLRMEWIKDMKIWKKKGRSGRKNVSGSTSSQAFVSEKILS
jgi:hypothetical protein